jgi:sugar phosphate isomerase/epimerase
MEFSCHIWGFNDMRLQEALGTIARLGFRYVDIGTGTHFNPARAIDANERQALFKEIREGLKLYNLKVADMYFFLQRISLNDEQKRSTDLTLFKALLPFAKALGAPGITVTPGLSHPDDDAEAWQRSIDALTQMHETAQEAELALSFEPHLDSMAFTIERIQRLLDAVEGLQLTLDWAHLVCQGIDHQAIIELLPYTRHIQIRQAKVGKLQTSFDAGSIDVAQVMDALFAADYAGCISVEIMQSVGWHGMEKVSSVIECSRMRDALREARDALQQ